MQFKISTPAILFCSLLLFASCNKSDKKETAKANALFARVSPAHSGITFANNITETDSANFFGDNYFYNGAGVATGDINNDGLPDIYVTANQSSSKLYLNKGNLKFEDITESAGAGTTGWCKGVAMADVNGDGWLDIYVCRSSTLVQPEARRNLLFINQQNGTFKESAAQYGLDDAGLATQAYFFDADADEDLDAYIVNHGVDPFYKISSMTDENAKYDPYITCRFYRNNGTKFLDETKQAGLLTRTFGLSAFINDFNEDGHPDIYLANDYAMPDFVYINNGKGVFTDATDNYLRHMSKFAMGSDAADFNNDGLTDLYTVDMLPEDNARHKMLFGAQNYDRYQLYVTTGYRHQRMQNCLQLNNGHGDFSDVALLAEVYRTDWSWSALFTDCDLDGWKDLLVTNGYRRDVTDLDFAVYKMRVVRENGGREMKDMSVLGQLPGTKLQKYAYRNNGDLTFSKKSDEWGLEEKRFSNGAAYADLDNDGDPDWVVNNINDTLDVYENRARKNADAHYLNIKLQGPAKNLFAVGASVMVHAGGQMQLQQQYPQRGFQSSVDYVLSFGLGKNTTVDSVVVRFADGKYAQQANVKADQLLTVKHADASARTFNKEEAPTLFVKVAAAKAPAFAHIENDFIDYKREPLLPHKFSNGGPGIAVADVNGDGLEDFFVGNASGSSGALMLQNAQGAFTKSSSQPWEADNDQEDMSALFLDADGDGDADLYVVSGGSEEPDSSAWYQDRFYSNDGKGKFARCADCLPVINSSGSCVVSADMDGDGDLDLFRGGRVVPGKYTVAPNSYLLRNDGGKFSDVTDQAAPALRHAGLVNTALWADFTGDKQPDLVVAGEWMPLMIFENKKGQLALMHTQDLATDKTTGWWTSLAATDADGDGDMDLIAGNYGLNTRMKTSADQPLTVATKDFDGNGTWDAIICQYEPDGKSYPIYSRDDFTDQMRPFKKVFLDYKSYAVKTIQEIFTPEQMKGMKTLYCRQLATSYAENKGGGKLELHTLPNEAQFAPTNSILISDFNNDGHSDILLAGNSHCDAVDLGYCDAGNGLLLTGDGKGNWKAVHKMRSGFAASLDARQMALLKGAEKQPWVLVANNNGPLQAWQLKQPLP